MAAHANGYSYSFIDRTQMNGARYYHLKIIDRDGNYIYSQILSVSSAQIGAISVMPTMAYSSINVSLPAVGQAKVSIFNTSGRLVKTMITGSETSNIDVSGLSRGEYFLNVFQGNNSYTTKFLKQ